jgi:hypothetical protein
MAAPALADPSGVGDSLVPTWGGERLDLGLLIGAMADNLLVEAGYDLPTTPTRDIPAALRSAAEWPMRVEQRRHRDGDMTAA